MICFSDTSSVVRVLYGRSMCGRKRIGDSINISNMYYPHETSKIYTSINAMNKGKNYNSVVFGAITRITTKLEITNPAATNDTNATLPLLAGNFPRTIQY
jgi:hypothetical protein